MNIFFTELEPITDLVELQITLKSKGGIMSVIIMPKASVADPAIGKIKPLQLSGSAKELDTEFLTAIKQPLEITAGIVSNVAEFEESNKNASQLTAAVKATNDAEKNKREAALKEFNKQIEIANAAVEVKDYPKALLALSAAMEATDKKEAIQKRIKEVEGLSGKGSLFAVADDDEELSPAESKAETEISEIEELTDDDQVDKTTDDTE